MVAGWLAKLFGSSAERELARLQKIVEQINSLEPEFQGLSDAALRAKTDSFRQRLAGGEALDDLLPEAFAAVREAGRRTIGLRHYDVQLLGGMLLHQGRVVEMRTGEGKTLVATLPLYLNALTGQGVHLVTPNDYLAKVGVQWMGPIYHALGLSVSVIQSGAGEPDKASYLYDPSYVSDDDRYQYLRPITRREAYRADITYGTNNEFGFDYLRDNMVLSLDQCVQRGLNFAIIDEADSILIDEARTPLIISGPAEDASEHYRRFAQIARQLQPDRDYTVDIREQVVILTEEGMSRVERLLGLPEGESLYDPQHAQWVAYLDNALRAKEFFHADKEYVVRDGQIIIVDEFTGRLMYGRRYSEGLHEAIEAKEGVDVRRQSLTYATITFQNFFRMYRKLAGMTGTAFTEREELRKIYDLDVTVLPTHVEYRARFGDLMEKDIPLSEAGVAFAGVTQNGYEIKVTVYDGPGQERYYRRLDLADQIYRTEQAKFKAVVEEIEAAHKQGRPVLVGTTAIETSERLSKLLNARKIPHNVLNAKYHEQEASIIAQAGRPGAVTIATNMAGRGVDILLGGNPEGLARQAIRQAGLDLTQIRAETWEEVLKCAQRGEDPTTRYAEPWVPILWHWVRQCAEDRKKVYALGGLHVIGTERHEARRIDNQLRGRAGRQGDPGSSRFYISLEDELMRRFGGERLKPWMERAGLDDAPLEFKMLASVIESVQERVEGYNFDIRKHVLEYDNVVNKQREVVYAERRKILSLPDLRPELMKLARQEIARIVADYTQGDRMDWNTEALLNELRKFVPLPRTFNEEALLKMEPDEIVDYGVELVTRTYDQLREQQGRELYRLLRQDEVTFNRLREQGDALARMLMAAAEEKFGPEFLEAHSDWPFRRFPEEEEARLEALVIEVARLYRDRQLMVGVLDAHWVRHLTNLDMLREGIGLRAIGNRNPLVAYQKEAFEMYQDMLRSVQQTIVRGLLPPPAPESVRVARRLPSRPAAVPPARRLTYSSSATTAPAPERGRKLPGRNDPCWCGSGKKYKYCHMEEDQRKLRSAGSR